MNEMKKNRLNTNQGQSGERGYALVGLMAVMMFALILTTADDDEIGLLGLRAGASGFLAKDVDIDVLPRALQGALSGEAAISRKLSMRLVEQLRRAPDGPRGMRPVKSPLTPREWEVIDLLAESRTTRPSARAATTRPVPNVVPAASDRTGESSVVLNRRAPSAATYVTVLPAA